MIKENKNLSTIKDQLKQKLPGLRNKHFSIWESYEQGVCLQCFKQNGTRTEYYGHVYRVVDVEKAILATI